MLNFQQHKAYSDGASKISFYSTVLRIFIVLLALILSNHML